MAKSVKLSQAAAEKLLTLLGGDDAFRALFKADCEAALKKVGAPAGAAKCMCKIRRLASKERIKAARAAIKRTLTADSEFTVFKLDAYHRA